MEKIFRVKLERSFKLNRRVISPPHIHLFQILFASFFYEMGLICIVNICPEVPTCNFQIFTIRIRTV